MKLRTLALMTALTGCLDFGPGADPTDDLGAQTDGALTADAAVDLTDANDPDAGAADAETPDGSDPDAAEDAATADATDPDAADPDAANPDTATPDGAPDAADPDATPQDPHAPTPAVQALLPAPGPWLWRLDPADTARVEDETLVVEPGPGGWHEETTGQLLYTELEGDFLIEVRVQTSTIGNRAEPPGTPFNVAGLLVRDPGSATENWVLLAVGFQSAAPGWEAKSTVDQETERYEADAAASGVLRICRAGDDFTLLRWLDGEDNWAETWPAPPLSRPDLPARLQVGVFTGGWEDPSIHTRFRGIRTAGPGPCDRALE